MQLLFVATPVLVIFTLFSFPALGEKKDLMSLSVDFNETSDNFDRRTAAFDYRSQRRELFWPWVEAATSRWDWGMKLAHVDGTVDVGDFSGQIVEGMIGGRPTPASYIEARLGRHRLNSDVSHGADSTLSYSLAASWKIVPSFSVYAQTADDFIYHHSLQSKAISDALTAETSVLRLQWRPRPDIRLGAGASRAEFSDSNVKRQYNFSALYGISPGWPWIWAGVAMETLSYDEEIDGYWSPSDFDAYGLQFESSFPINDRLSAVASATLNRNKENNQSWETGGHITIGTDYVISGKYHLRFNFNKLRSPTWSENTFKLSLSGPLL